MRFLVVTKGNRHLMPPEMVPQFVEAMTNWLNRYTSSKKIEQAWGLAGMPGGAGILNVSSLEELDSIMVQYPFGAFSTTEVYPLTDIHGSMDRLREAFRGAVVSGAVSGREAAASRSSRR